MVLANETLRLEFDPDTGALIHVATADGGWQILDRPGLGLSFRLLVPLPNRRNNNVFGEQQRVASVETAPDGRSIRFRLGWCGFRARRSPGHQVDADGAFDRAPGDLHA